MSNRAFLTVEIDRVSEFISNSRKTQDAWIGSYILSYIMARVAAKAVSDFSVKIEYPFVEELPLFQYIRDKKWPYSVSEDSRRVSSFPDRLTLSVDEAKAEAIARCLCDEAEAAWKKAWSASIQVLTDTSTQPYMKELTDADVWEEQCHGYFRLHWAVTPIDGTEADSYKRHLDHLRAVNDSRPLVWRPQHGVKCSLCGNLSALPVNSRNIRNVWDRLVNSHCYGRLIESGERLSAVYLTKRLAGRGFISQHLHLIDGSAFPSVMSVASADFRREVLHNCNDASLLSFMDALGALRGLLGDTDSEIGIPLHKKIAKDDTNRINFAHLDGQWFFNDSYRLENLKREFNIDANDEEISELAKTALQGLGDLSRECDSVLPRPYYVILKMDGDRMGEFMADYDNVKYGTRALSEFSTRVVPSILHSEHSGQIIYAGGDEVLAFLPISDLLPALIKLRHVFSGTDPNEFLARLSKGNTSAQMGLTAIGALAGQTMSAGVVISPCRSSLRLAILAVEDVLDQAKRAGRNRVHFRVLKRSGAPLDVGWEFSSLDSKYGPELFLSKSMELCRKGWMSRGVFYDLAKDFKVVSGNGNECAYADTQRIICRHFPVKDDTSRAEARDEYIRITSSTIADFADKPESFAANLYLTDWFAREAV